MRARQVRLVLSLPLLMAGMIGVSLMLLARELLTLAAWGLDSLINLSLISLYRLADPRSSGAAETLPLPIFSGWRKRVARLPKRLRDWGLGKGG